MSLAFFLLNGLSAVNGGQWQPSVLPRRRLHREPKLINGWFRSEPLPYQVGLYAVFTNLATNDRESGNCGGVLISNSAVLTAAHCLKMEGKRLDYVFVAAGTTLRVDNMLKEDPQQGVVVNNAYVKVVQQHHKDAQVYKVWPSNVEVHQGYNKTNFFFNDIAIIKNTFNLNGGNLQIAAIPTRYVGHGDVVTVSGWGSTVTDRTIPPVLPDTLEEADLTVTGCLLDNKAANVTETQFCAKDPARIQAVCGGDSGGPAVVGNSNIGYTVVGIVSFTNLVECKSNGWTDVFTATFGYRDWIQNNA